MEYQKDFDEMCIMIRRSILDFNLEHGTHIDHEVPITMDWMGTQTFTVGGDPITICINRSLMTPLPDKNEEAMFKRMLSWSIVSEYYVQLLQ